MKELRQDGLKDLWLGVVEYVGQRAAGLQKGKQGTMVGKRLHDGEDDFGR